MLYSVFVNVATVLLGGTLGLLFRRFLSKRLTDTILSGLGFFVRAALKQRRRIQKNMLIAIQEE